MSSKIERVRLKITCNNNRVLTCGIQCRLPVFGLKLASISDTNQGQSTYQWPLPQKLMPSKRSPWSRSRQLSLLPGWSERIAGPVCELIPRITEALSPDISIIDAQLYQPRAHSHSHYDGAAPYKEGYASTTTTSIYHRQWPSSIFVRGKIKGKQARSKL